MHQHFRKGQTDSQSDRQIDLNFQNDLWISDLHFPVSFLMFKNVNLMTDESTNHQMDIQMKQQTEIMKGQNFQLTVMRTLTLASSRSETPESQGASVTFPSNDVGFTLTNPIEFMTYGTERSSWVAVAWLAIGESVIPGWTFAAATSLEGQSLSQKCAGTLTSDDITKVGAGSRGLAIAGWKDNKANTYKSRSGHKSLKMA